MKYRISSIKAKCVRAKFITDKQGVIDSVLALQRSKDDATEILRKLKAGRICRIRYCRNGTMLIMEYERLYADTQVETKTRVGISTYDDSDTEEEIPN